MYREFRGEYFFGTRNLRQLRKKWERNISMEVKEMRCEDQRWMKLVRVGDMTRISITDDEALGSL
jgi:hypothetical protein